MKWMDGKVQQHGNATEIDRMSNSKIYSKSRFEIEISTFLFEIFFIADQYKNTPFDQKSPQHLEVDVLRLRAQEGQFYIYIF